MPISRLFNTFSLVSFFPILFTISLSGCKVDLDGNEIGGFSNKGTLSLLLTDAPIDDASAVYIQFSGIEITGAENKTITFDSPIRINLMDYQNGKTYRLLDGQRLKSGAYTQVKLLIDSEANNDTVIQLGSGATYELTLSSSAQSGIALSTNFTIDTGSRVEFALDFDLRESITQTSDTIPTYNLKPVIRVVDVSNAGSISGSVAVSVCEVNDSAAIYAYKGAVSEPNDIGSSSAPMATTTINTDLSYEISYLEPGDYTLALICNAQDDDTETDDVEIGDGNGFDGISEKLTVVADTVISWSFD